MDQVSLSDIVTGAWEEIKGYVLKALKEAVEAVLLKEQRKVLGRGRYQRGGSRGWRWGYRQRKSFLTPWGSLEGLKVPRIREEGQEVSWLRKNERRLIGLRRMPSCSTLGDWLRRMAEVGFDRDTR